MKNLIEKIGSNLYKMRILYFVLIVIIVIFVGFGVKNIYIESSNESYFLQGDKTLAAYNQFKNDFGSDEFVYLIFNMKDVFTKDNLEKLVELKKDLKSVPYVDTIMTIVSAPYIEGTEDGMIEVHDFIENIPETNDDLQKLKNEATHHFFYKNRLISEDGKLAGVMIKTKIAKKDNFRFEIKDKVFSIIDNPKYKSLNIHVAGMPINMPTYQMTIKKELGKSFLLSLIINIFILILLFRRRLSAILIPILIIIFSTVFIFGFMGWLNVPLSMLSIILVVLLVTVSIADSMHLSSEFQDSLYDIGDKKKTFIESMKKVFFPCFLTSLTTAVGFLSLVLSKIKHVRNLGIFASIAMVIAFILTFIISAFIFSLVIYRKDKRKKENGSNTISLWDRMWEKFFNIIVKFIYSNPLKIVIVSIIIVIISIIGMTRLKIESNFKKNFKPSHRLRKDMDFVDSHMGGASSLEVMINSKMENGAKNPNLLKEVNDFQYNITNKFDNVVTSFSIVDIIKEVNKVINKGDQKYFTIPDNNKAVAQLLLLYEMADPDRLNNFITSDYSKMRINLGIKIASSSDTQKIVDYIYEYFNKHNLAKNSVVSVTGSGYMMVKMKQYLTRTQIESFIIAFIIISLIMILIFKPFKLGILTIYPNVIPILVVLGVCGFFGIDLDVVSILFSVIAIGLIVDDTIHFVNRYKKYFMEKRNYKYALSMTARSSGKAITFTSLALSLSFITFLFSNFVVVSQFGILMILTVILAYLCDLFVLPALITLVKPFGKFEKK